jgi:hypothetical protein
MPINVTATLRQAMQSLQSERRQIDGRIRAVQTALGISTNSHTSSNSRRPASRRSRMSPGARRALSKRMKASWAAKRKTEATVKRKKS